MSARRTAATVFAAFLLSNLFAIAIHGFILAADYEPYRGTLLRDFAGGPGWQVRRRADELPGALIISERLAR